MLKRKKITLQDCYSLFEKYGDLGLHVNTPYGYKHIEACAVTAYNSEVYQLEAENGLKIDTSPDHLVKLETNEFTKVTEVNVGLDKVQTNEGLSVIKSVTKLPYRKDLLDIQVAEVKQYYSNGIVSHNSTILDALLYLFFGKTIGIQKREKHGDNRFINNKRELEYCEVGAIIDINGASYRTIRNTERKWNRTKTELSTCSTSVTYEELDSDGNPIASEAEDKRKKTEKLIQESIGTFDDFLRTSFINADTLNNLLAIDHAAFVDSVLRDSGLDIYEKKLDEFKKWKKEVYGKSTRINTDVVKNDEEILTAYEFIKEKEAELVTLNQTLKDAVARLVKGHEYKETLIKKLYKIDTESANLNIEDIKQEIKGLLDKKKAKVEEQNGYMETMSELPETYDVAGMKALQDEKNQFFQWQNSKGREIDYLKRDILVKENELDKIETQKIQKGTEITVVEARFDSKIEELFTKINLINKEIEFLETSKTCPTCLREKDQSTIKGIQATIATKQVEIARLENAEIENLVEDKEISKNNLIQEIDDLETSKSPIKLEIKGLGEQIDGVKKEITTRTLEVDDIAFKIALIEKQKDDVAKRNQLYTEAMNIPAQIQVIELSIEMLKSKMENYDNTQLQLRENAKIENQIIKAQERIDELTNLRLATIKQIDNLKDVAIVHAQQTITRLEELNDKFKKQERRDLVLKIYEDCIHRDGIPTMILKRSLEFINIELENLLDAVNFNVYIDDELNMRMYDYGRKDAEIAVIQGSGMQRTFASLALRLVLRKLNNKSKSNVIMMDEILGKLDPENLELFVELMKRAKEEIEVIVIIEHGYADLINPDHLITVDITDKGVSFFEIKY
jgi:DNA repair exonuclease SbcCD ATPase subunit